MPATYIDSSAVYNAANPAVVGSSGDALVALAWDITAAPAGWTLQANDGLTPPWRVYTKTHAGETGTYAFTGGGTYPTIFVTALSGTTENSYGTPIFTNGVDTTADTPGADGTGVALFGVVSFGVITTGSQTNSFVQRQFDGSNQAAAFATKTVTVASGAVQYTVAASGYFTVILVMADVDAGGGTNRYVRSSGGQIWMPGTRLLA